MNIILIIFLKGSLLAFPKEVLKGKVVDVPDGNTIELLTEENESYKIQLAGVDCPETDQPFGIEAKHLLEKSLKGKDVEAFVEIKNRWGIRQAIIITKSGKDPRLELLQAGLAWTSE